MSVEAVDPFAALLTCIVCGSERRVLVFGLRRTQRISLSSGEPYYTSRGVGSIRMCEKCWERFAKPRMKKRRMKEALG